VTSSRLFMSRTLCAGALAFVGAGCGLSSDISRWNVEVQGSGGGDEVAFCPVTGPLGTPAASFVSSPGSFVFLEIVDDDIHTFSQLGNDAGGGSTAMFELFGAQMAFDLGPIGLAYADDDDTALFAAGVTVTRRLVSGRRSGDDDVELQYEYVPACTEVALGDAGADGTCDCAPRVLTWHFTGE
jgi:hypothetical protein